MALLDTRKWVSRGGLGYELAYIADGMLGWGTFLLLILSLIIFIIYFFNVTVIDLFAIKDPKPMGNAAILPDDADEETVKEVTVATPIWPMTKLAWN